MMPGVLQVASKLHQQQLTRAIKRVILGLGAAPSAPRNLRCRPVSCAAVACAWDPPAEPGHPPFHKLKLERLWQVCRGLLWCGSRVYYKESAAVGHVTCSLAPSPCEVSNPKTHRMASQADANGPSTWVTANGELDDEDRQYLDTNVPEVPHLAQSGCPCDGA